MKSRRFLLLSAVLAVPLAACVSDPGDKNEPAADLSGDASPPEAGSTDLSPLGDIGPIDGPLVAADIGAPLNCLSNGAEPVLSFTGASLGQAVDLRADLDLEGDGLPDLAVSVQTDAESGIVFLSGVDAAERGRFVRPRNARLELLPGVWPQPDLLTAVEINDIASYLILERRAADTSLHVVDADRFTAIGEYVLPSTVDSITILAGGFGGAVALINLGDDRCILQDLGLPDASLPVDRCRLRPAWDFNVDGLPELFQFVAGLTALIDARTLERVGELPGPAYAVGVAHPSLVPGAPAQGPVEPREMGSELAIANGRNGSITIGYLAPDDFRQREESLPLPGMYESATFGLTSRGLRLFGVERRAAVKELDIIELVDRQVRGQLGPFVNLEWQLGIDLDGDHQEELMVRTGPRADGIDGDLKFHDPADGALKIEMPRDRSARYDLAFWRHEGLLRAADVDGCPGVELVSTRQGIVNSTGNRPSRLEIFSAGGDRNFQGQSESVTVHKVVLADLDGVPPVEIVELKTAEGGGAAVSVYTRP